MLGGGAGSIGLYHHVVVHLVVAVTNPTPQDDPSWTISGGEGNPGNQADPSPW